MIKTRQQLVFPVKHHLMKVAQLAQYRPDIKVQLDIYQGQYDVLEEEKEVFLSNVEKAGNKAAYLSKNERKKEIGQFVEQMNVLRNRYQALSASLIALGSHEDKVRLQIHTIKEKYRTLKQGYASCKSSFIALPLIDQMFATIASQFLAIDELIGNGEIDKAALKIKEVEDKVNVLVLGVESGAKLIKKVGQLWIEEIKALDDYYYSLNLGNLVLAHINFSLRRDEIEKKFNNLISMLDFFNFDAASIEFSDVQQLVEGLRSDLEKEESARIYFRDESLKIFNKVASLQSEFIVLKKMLVQQKQIYVITQESRLEELISLMDEVERGRDLLLEKSLDEEAATFLLEALNLLEDKIKKSQSKMSALNHEIASYRVEAERIYNQLGSYRLVIGDILIHATNCNIPSFYQATRLRTKIVFTELDKVRNVLMTSPINLELAKRIEINIKDDINALFIDVVNHSELLTMLEQLIYRANAFKDSFAEVNQTLIKAEVFLENGDIASAYKIVNSLLIHIGAS